MKDELVSMFIDDEMDLDEKIEFVEQVHADAAFKDSTIEFLNLEKGLRGDVVERIPEVSVPARKTTPRLFRPLPLAVASLAAVAALFVFLFWPVHQESANPNEPYRFVLYRPDVAEAAIAGDFTGWGQVPLQRIGSSGYWEKTLNIPKGEHRYIFILGGTTRVPDPTVMTREKDDFGGENSILMTGTSI
jgi:hypothetical protein